MLKSTIKGKYNSSSYSKGLGGGGIMFNPRYLLYPLIFSMITSKGDEYVVRLEVAMPLRALNLRRTTRHSETEN